MPSCFLTLHCKVSLSSLNSKATGCPTTVLLTVLSSTRHVSTTQSSVSVVLFSRTSCDSLAKVIISTALFVSCSVFLSLCTSLTCKRSSPGLRPGWCETKYSSWLRDDEVDLQRETGSAELHTDTGTSFEEYCPP